MFHRIILQLALFGLLLSLPAHAGSIEEIQRGNPDRKVILDALRPAIQVQMRGPIEFVVQRLDVYEGHWAFVVVDPQRPGGTEINPQNTGFREFYREMDGFTVYALLLRTKNGRWNLITHDIGPTDVSYAIWPQIFGVPSALLGLPAN